MADNRYGEYLGDQQKERNSGFSTLATIGAVGAGITVVAHPGLRRGALDALGTTGRFAAGGSLKVASYLNRATGFTSGAQNVVAYAKAMNHALDSRSPLSHLRNPQRAEQRFDEMIRMQLAEKERHRISPLGNALPTKIERTFGQLKYDKKLQNTEYFREAQRQVAVADIQRKMPQYFGQGQDLRAILSSEHRDFFNDPTPERIRGMMEKYNGTNPDLAYRLRVQNQDHFISSMMDSLQTYKGDQGRQRLGRGAVKRQPNGGKYTVDNGVEVQGAASVADKIHQQFVEANTAKDDWFSKMMAGAGYRRMLVKDALEQREVELPQTGKQMRWVNKLFSDASVVIQRKQDAVSIDRRLGSKLAGMANKDASILKLAVDDHIFINDAGDIKNFTGFTSGLHKAASFFQENFQIPFLRFNPLDLAHWTTWQGIKDAPTNYLLQRGTIHPALQGQAETVKHPMAHNQDAAAGALAKDYFVSGNKVYDLVSGDLIEDNAYIASARFGMVPRALASMANLHRKDLRNRGFLANLFDIGGQETEHIWNQMSSTFTKFSDPNWARNRYKALLNPQALTSDVESSYKDLYAELYSRTTSLSDDAVSHLNKAVQQTNAYGTTNVDLTKMRNTQEIMETFGRIAVDLKKGGGALVRDEFAKPFGEVWRNYTNNPVEFLKDKRIVSDNAPYMMGSLQAVDAHETNLVSAVDDVKRLVHQHAIAQLERRKQISVGDLMKQGIASGALEHEALEGVRDLSVLSRLQTHWEDIYKSASPQDKELALGQFQRSVFNDRGFAASFSDAVERHSPLWAMGPGDKPPQYFGYTEHTVVKKARGYQWMMENLNEQIRQGENPLAALGKSAWGVVGQPFTGRKNLKDVTTLSLMSYYMGERLDNMAAKMGLGMSQKNRGSLQGILGNQFMRRIVLPYAAIQQAQYLDGMTGDFFSDNAADSYANMTMDVGFAKDILGLNQAGKWAGGMMPGMDQFWHGPIGGAIKYGSFGLFGDTRSDKELKQYYESGEDPVRKGRWWGVGSNTPWEGGKIDRFEPNWYRRLKSDYQFTDTMYGSESEYWANHWMPTLTHPFAPLNHFLFDPDHYANKHKEDRPYPVTGGIEELDMIPLVGPLLNRTIGGILNPYTERGDLGKAHRQYQEDLNAYVKGQYDSALGGGTIQFMPAGGYQVLSQSTGFGGGFGEGLSSLAAPGETVGYGAGTGGKGGASGASMAYLSAMNLAMSGQGAGSANGLMAPIRPISTLSDLRDPDNYAELRDFTNPAGGGNVFGDTWYSLTEMAGIYGFSANMFGGINTNVRSSALAHAGIMGSYQRAWWDLEMGGLGGDMSELFRRYVPRDPRKQYYNPYRNTMPDWMPGVNYFLDFQHGDPYAKVAKGEMRLPGDAYETLNQLHPDQFGDYGAFDRFKILADVAPYSDEYKFWRRMVSQMNQQGMLDDKEVVDYREVRDQVAQKKEKYHLYPYQFKNADVVKETVHISKVIDANTFLTSEHPNNPIRLANVHIKSDATDAQEWLQQYIHEGAEIQIGLDADPLSRIRDDTMNTMHAVVYSNGQDQNPWFMSTAGQSLNGMLARRSWDKKDSVTVKQENSAVGTAAMYDSADITVGKLNEWIVHSVLPNIPVLGTIFDKFIQVRSPLEMYKKNEVYGKSWRPWTDPWGGWIQPMLESAATKNPLVAAAQGYGLGWLATRKNMKYHGKWLGAAVFGTIAAVRSIDEFIGNRTPGGDNYAWIPKRREKEREINEYFDVLKYMKYKGLYERARQEALSEEGIDVETVVNENKDRGKQNKKARQYLDAEKKWLSISKNFGYVDDDATKEKLDKARARLKLIDTDRPAVNIGPRSMQALQYKLQYESTLYGADANGDMTKIFRALPSKDREFFSQFMTASPDEREEILRLVPKDQRRFYQAKWGMEADSQPNLNSYFMKHYLPGTDWEGWRPDTNLDDIKLKVVRNEGLEATEFGMWGDDEKRADMSGVDSVPVFRPSMTIDVARITKILEGAGLRDVNVTMSATSSSENRLDTVFNLMMDRADDIKSGLASNLHSIFA